MRGSVRANVFFLWLSECYCGASVNTLSVKQDDSKCNLPCKGNGTQICGGSLLLSVYKRTSAAAGGARPVGMGSVLAFGVAVCALLVMG